jgi:hypothetical protein
MSTAAENPEAFPCQGQTSDGWSNEEEASATCACGAVQMVIVSIHLVIRIPCFARWLGRAIADEPRADLR